MPSIRDIKRKARRDLHSLGKVAAIYLAPVDNPTPRNVTVRIHTKWDATTMDGASGNGTMVSRQSIFPKILFMRDELADQGIVLRRGGIISIEAGEAYKLDHDEPPDDISQSWFVTQLDEDDTVGLPVPEVG